MNKKKTYSLCLYLIEIRKYKYKLLTFLEARTPYLSAYTFSISTDVI